MLEPEFEVVGIAVSVLELVELVAELKPDIVVIDLVMPELNGFEAAERVNAIRGETKAIYMTMGADFWLAAEAFQRGASGFVDKTRFPEELRVAVRWAVRGELRLSASFLSEMTMC
jgi:DNA-binding NarL/FixJ family response regulator